MPEEIYNSFFMNNLNDKYSNLILFELKLILQSSCQFDSDNVIKFGCNMILLFLKNILWTQKSYKFNLHVYNLITLPKLLISFQ